MVDALLPLAKIARLLAVPEAAIRQWRTDGSFPPPVVLPDGRRRWRASEISGWLAALRPDVVAGQWPDSGRTVAGEPTAGLSELACDVYQALQEVGDWLKGPELERAVGGDCDHTGGSFRRAIRSLRGRNLIESDRSRGYRAIASGQSSGQRPAK